MPDAEWSKMGSLIAAGASKELFRSFMALVSELDRLQGIGGQALQQFQQELELCRRPALDQQSEVLKVVFQNAPSPMLATYAETGGRHSHLDRVNIRHLDSAIRSLRSLKTQAHGLIQELEDKVKQATVIAQNDLDLYLDRARVLNQSKNGAVIQDATSMLLASDYATTMGLLLHMLELDYTMQEKIIDALDLETPSEILENYCTMWTLRPYVDVDVFSQALKL